jgi:hypothetical protein
MEMSHIHYKCRQLLYLSQFTVFVGFSAAFPVEVFRPNHAMHNGHGQRMDHQQTDKILSNAF